MANNIYGFIALTGGASGALDEIDGDELIDGDLAFGCVNSAFSAYRLDADSGAAESSPDIIAPDANAGDKRWIKQESGGGTGGSGDFLVTQVFS